MSSEDFTPGDRVQWDWGQPDILPGVGKYLGYVGHGEAVVQPENRPDWPAGKLLLVPFFMLQAFHG